VRRDYPPPLTRQQNARCTDFLDMPLTTGAATRFERFNVRTSDTTITTNNSATVPKASGAQQRDAMRESVGHIFAMQGHYLDHDYVGHERDGVRSAIRRLTAGAGILDQLGWVQQGDRDSYRLEADDDISELMREWVGRLPQGGEAMDPVDQPMLRAWSRRRSLSSSLQGPNTGGSATCPRSGRETPAAQRRQARNVALDRAGA
jgi:hypothetical protein